LYLYILRNIIFFPDANSQHVHMADEAYLIGPAASTQSYLNQDKIFEVII
jgi:3-methylcrotonyl-CoA carboxylase alpha subunit